MTHFGFLTFALIAFALTLVPTHYAQQQLLMVPQAQEEHIEVPKAALLGRLLYNTGGDNWLMTVEDSPGEINTLVRRKRCQNGGGGFPGFGGGGGGIPIPGLGGGGGGGGGDGTANSPARSQGRFGGRIGQWGRQAWRQFTGGNGGGGSGGGGNSQFSPGRSGGGRQQGRNNGGGGGSSGGWGFGR